MGGPPRARINGAPDQVTPPAEGKQPGERGPIVIEYTGQEQELLTQRLDEAQRRLVAGGVLYLTVPYGLDGEPVVAALRTRFSRIGPLNVGSNPRLQNNDVRTRSGYLCIK
jgi:hypothetical protein